MDTTLLDMEGFLKMFPDPEETFYGTPQRTPCAAYVEHASTQLYNDYPQLSTYGIELIFDACEQQYAPTRRAIDNALAFQGNESTYILGEDEYRC